MNLRDGKRGPWLGCRAFPKCRGREAFGKLDEKKQKDLKTQLDALLAGVASGAQVLVLRGEAGVGKSALLDHAANRAEGFRVTHVVGVESDMELAFAGLQQLCAPLLDHLDDAPQAEVAGVGVELGADVHLGAVAVLGGALDRVLHRLDHDGAVDHLLGRDRVRDRDQLRAVGGGGAGGGGCH